MTTQSAALYPLSERQAEIANLVVAGKSTREIAEMLHLSPRTVEHHIEAIFNKFGVRSRVELAVALLGQDLNLRADATAPAKTNLPAQRTRLIGREAEIADIVRLLQSSRLITVTGAGGVGKTRIALAVGDAQLPHARAGVWLADLAPLTQGSPVAGTIARALSMKESPSQPLLETLVAFLKPQSVLLILDNCEHLIAEAAGLADALLRGCPHVRILATSREPLRISGEQTYRLPSLPVPKPQESFRLSAAAATEYAAVVLFVERARAIDQHFALKDDDAPIVAEICRRLDGIPLAIELAAVRAGNWPLETIAKRLDERFTLLMGADRAALPRHQTMRALIDWSYDLLSPQEQQLLCALSVFAGTWTLEAASAVFGPAANDSGQTAELVSSLVDKSLVAIEHTGGMLRYRLLESIRAYASERNRSADEAPGLAERHARYYIGLARNLALSMDAGLSDAEEEQWRTRVELELDDVRAALLLMLEQRTNCHLGTWLAIEAFNVIREISPVDARRWIALALDTVDDRTSPTIAARIRLASAISLYDYTEYERALELASPLPEIFERLGVQLSAYISYCTVGFFLIQLGRVSDGEPLLTTALAGFRSLQKLRWVVRVLQFVSYARRHSGDASGSRASLQEAIRISKAHGFVREELAGTEGLALTEFALGNGRLAIEIAEAALATACHSKKTNTVVSVMVNLAAYYIGCNRWEDARRILHAALKFRDDQHPWLVWILQHAAALTILEFHQSPTDERFISGLTLLGHVDADIRRRGALRDQPDLQEYQRVSHVLADIFSAEELAAHFSTGTMISWDQAVDLAVLLTSDEKVVSRV
jgi:predicted ATPase/DNA-binding CsgD family transcriptional regulator